MTTHTLQLIGFTGDFTSVETPSTASGGGSGTTTRWVGLSTSGDHIAATPAGVRFDAPKSLIAVVLDETGGVYFTPVARSTASAAYKALALQAAQTFLNEHSIGGLIVPAEGVTYQITHTLPAGRMTLRAGFTYQGSNGQGGTTTITVDSDPFALPVADCKSIQGHGPAVAGPTFTAFSYDDGTTSYLMVQPSFTVRGPAILSSDTTRPTVFAYISTTWSTYDWAPWGAVPHEWYLNIEVVKNLIVNINQTGAINGLDGRLTLAETDIDSLQATADSVTASLATGGAVAVAIAAAASAAASAQAKADDNEARLDDVEDAVEKHTGDWLPAV